MRIRNLFMAGLATAALMSGAVAVSNPAHAAVTHPTTQHTKIVIEDRGYDITVDEIVKIIEAEVKKPVGAPTKLAVVTDNGRPLTPEQFKTLLSGSDADDTKLLSIVDRPAPGLTLGDLVEPNGVAQKTVFSGSIGPFQIEIKATAQFFPPKVKVEIDVSLDI